MILKGSQRSGAKQLASHLLNTQENDHVSVMELRGFMAQNLTSAFCEAHAVSKGTQCKQFLFSLSLNPPQDFVAGEEMLRDAADRAEKALGLDGQPRAIIIHEKEGRRHAHVVWSRINADSMTAITMSHFKRRLTALSRELYLEHGWELPNGLRHDGGKSPLNFTLDEWQQAKRIGVDPREIRQSFRQAWEASDDLKSFRRALEERGYFLARGDRCGFVALNVHGDVYAVPRMVGEKTRDVKDRLGDPSVLPSVDERREELSEKLTVQLIGYLDQAKARHAAQLEPLNDEKLTLREAHREERHKLEVGQKKRWAEESRARSERLHSGFKGLWQSLSGKARAIKRENEAQAWQSAKRDQKQRDELARAQMVERYALQERINALRRRQIKDREVIARDVGKAMAMSDYNRDLDVRRDKEQELDRSRRNPLDFRRGF